MNLPELYTANNNCNSILGKYIFRKYGHLIQFKKGHSILEIGCADGNTTANAILPNLPKDYKEFILSDISEVMLAFAKKKPELSHLKMIKLDIENTTIPDGFGNRFDRIISFLTLHWITDVRQAVQNMYDMLKPGGSTFCVFLTESPTDYAYRALRKDPKWSKYDTWVFPHCHTLNISKIFEDSVAKCGFRNYSLEPFEYVSEFTSEKEVRGLYTAVNCNVEKIPQEFLAEYLDDYFGYFKEDKLWSFEKSQDGQDRITSIMKLVVLYAEKPETNIV